MDQLFHNPGLNHIGQQILNQVNTDIQIETKHVCQTWTQIVDFVKSNEKLCLMYFYSNFGLNHIGKKILMGLKFKEIQAARGVCKTWKNIIDNYQFWFEKTQCKDKRIVNVFSDDEDDDGYPITPATIKVKHWVNSKIICFEYLNLLIRSFEVFEFNQETHGLTKNAISLFCLRYNFLKRTEGDDWERNTEFYEIMWAEIGVKYLKMYKIHHLWVTLLQTHTWKNMDKTPNVLRRVASGLNRRVYEIESDFVSDQKMIVEFDPLDDQIMVLNNLTNFCLNPNLKHIGQKIFAYLKFKDQATSRQVCFSFKEAIDLMWAENVGISITRLYLRLFYNRNSARKLIKQIQTAQKNLHQITKKRSGSPINQISKRAKIVEEKASISWRPKDEQTLRWTSDITEGSKETKISGKFGQISWKQNGDFELRWTAGKRPIK